MRSENGGMVEEADKKEPYLIVLVMRYGSLKLILMHLGLRCFL